MPVNKQDLTFCLSRVEKPARYIGREMNVIRKDPQNKNVRVCLIYPDTYEVGTPFLGFQILYHIINKRDDFLAERCFAPWIDMEALLRENEIPLFSLENHLALKEFNVLGFTLQYEMTYTNILNCLDLGRSEER